MNIKASSLVCVPFALALSSATARADCFQQLGTYHFNGDTITDSDAITGGSSCRHPNRTNGTSRFGSVSVVSPAKNGKLSAGVLSVTYTPNPGFKGSDQYSIQVCGRRHNAPNCSTINVAVTVQ
jgi:type 1 fimbria pilin